MQTKREKQTILSGNRKKFIAAFLSLILSMVAKHAPLKLTYNYHHQYLCIRIKLPVRLLKTQCAMQM